MRNKEVKEKINTAISNSVPDVLDDIIIKCEKKRGFKKNMKQKENNKSNIFNPKAFGVLATAVVCVFAVFGFGLYNKSGVSTIDFDVNPSIEIKTNRKEQVVDFKALNDDGKKILDDMELENVDLDVAVNAIIGSMLKQGYISEIQNSILVSVKNKDSEKAKEIEEKITKEIDKLLAAQKIEGAVITQSYKNNEMKKQAEKYNVSEGKAHLINKIISSGLKDKNGVPYTFETLSKLDITELKLLIDYKEIKIEEITSTGKANDKGLVGYEKATSIALEKANLKESDVKGLKVELDVENGILVYEVEFHKGNNEYDYEINAETGVVINFDIETDDDFYYKEDNDKEQNQSTNNYSYITKEKAKSIALSDAKLTSAVIKEYEIELDKDDKVAKYEIEFKYNGKEYSYEINAKTGAIIKKEIERDND